MEIFKKKLNEEERYLMSLSIDTYREHYPTYSKEHPRKLMLTVWKMDLGKDPSLTVYDEIEADFLLSVIFHYFDYVKNGREDMILHDLYNEIREHFF